MSQSTPLSTQENSIPVRRRGRPPRSSQTPTVNSATSTPQPASQSHEVQDIRESRESGTAQPDTELGQVIHQWRDHEAALEKEAEDTKKTTAQLDREAKEAEIHRRNLLRGLKRKQVINLDSDATEEEAPQDTEADTDDDVKIAQKIKKIRKRKTKQRRRENDIRREEEILHGFGKQISDALTTLATSMAPELSEQNSTEKRLNNLEDLVKAQQKANEERAERMERLLVSILTKLPTNSES
ncbi:hypothetical protein BDZ91DRAFT_803405 [Kalaharituber pfeilii]|nr:hypothetical protein BDZ91DRAFT_803405 [Kalaharituber pfeilii]